MFPNLDPDRESYVPLHWPGGHRPATRPRHRLMAWVGVVFVLLGFAYWLAVLVVSSEGSRTFPGYAWWVGLACLLIGGAATLVAAVQGEREHHQAMADVRAQQSPRHFTLERAWGRAPDNLDTVQLVCRLVKEEGVWPADQFLPDDPVDVLFWDFRDFRDLLDRLAEEWHVEPWKAEYEELWLKARTLGDIVEAVEQVKAERGRSAREGNQ